MNFELINFSAGLIQKQAASEVLSCNNYTKQFGLVLTHTQALDLIETRSASLKASGRIEFGGGVTNKIIKAFCDSPYVSMQNYAYILHELTEMFYYYKNESMDLVTDDELITFMKTAFDGACQGSLELLSGRELQQFAKQLRFGSSGDSLDNPSLDLEEDFDE